jgi:Na+-transporting methylmalonyl-CoA/oxaloacetate decarboxylase gamma subunit
MEFSFLDALITTLVAMTIVFSLLVILMFIIKLQSFILNFSVNKVKIDKVDIINDEEKLYDETQNDDLEDDLELVAVIAAGLSAYLDKPEANLRIKSIKRINSNSFWGISEV